MITAKDYKNYLLLQVTDALFPIGGYSHSYGFETYIQMEMITDPETAFQYITDYLRYSVCYTDFLAVRLAYEGAAKGRLEDLLVLEQQITAGKIPAEIRSAGHKLGSRFAKTVGTMGIKYQTSIFENFIKAAGKTATHSIVYGVFCAACEMELLDVLEYYIYSQTSALVTNCVKSVPLSQTAGQQILVRCFPVFDEVIEAVNSADAKMLGLSMPGYDIRCMQHETLYSRIYMS